MVTDKHLLSSIINSTGIKEFGHKYRIAYLIVSKQLLRGHMLTTILHRQ
jgi:hypothetical protein